MSSSDTALLVDSNRLAKVSQSGNPEVTDAPAPSKIVECSIAPDDRNFSITAEVISGALM